MRTLSLISFTCVFFGTGSTATGLVKIGIGVGKKKIGIEVDKEIVSALAIGAEKVFSKMPPNNTIEKSDKE